MSEPTSDLMEATVKSVAGFMGETIGELIKDEVHFLRWKNVHRILEKAEAYLNKRRAQGRRCLPVSLAVRFLDAASLEEDTFMQELWSRLLANSVDLGSGYNPSKIHISILSEMNALDARVLKYFGSKGWLQFKSVGEMTGKELLDCETIAAKLSYSETETGLAIGNLWRLGCLIQEPTYESGIGPSTATNSTFRPSPLGLSLLHAVNFPLSET